MLDRVDRYAPESASWRLGIGAVLTVPGLAIALFGLYGFLLTVVDPSYVESLPALAMLLLGGLAAAVGATCWPE